jgi:HAMP domain-containing protein
MKTWIKNLRVRKKILLIIIINIFFTALMSIISHQSLNKVDEIKADIVQVGKAASRQLTADMMHDALRADVYNGFLTKAHDIEGKKAVKRDLAEHVGIFKSSLHELKHLNIDHKIVGQVNKIRIPLDAYIISSKNFIDKALYTNYDLYSTQGQKEMHTYKQVFDNLAVEMEALSEVIEKEYTHQQDLLTDYTHQVQLILFILGLLVAIIALTLSLYVSKLIEKPIIKTEEVLSKISEGEITELMEADGKDETANMIRSLNTVVENLTNVTEYVTEVGNGNFESNIEIFHNKGKIFDSLHSMSNAIKTSVEEERKRNWTSEGLAKFVDITRDIQDIDVFYNNILSNLIRYINANQGYLYVMNDDNEEDVFLEVKAVYAYGKQRYLEEKREIRYKQGLVGQAWFDKEPLYFTEIPANFVNITSGIGEATPRCIFIVPLLVNEKVLGVIEIASFQAMEDFHKDFVTKLSETIASTVDSAKTNHRTRKLLAKSQEAEQAIAAQEEEIRQNMEEMVATQAEMERTQRNLTHEKNKLVEDYEARIAALENQLKTN